MKSIARQWFTQGAVVALALMPPLFSMAGQPDEQDATRSQAISKPVTGKAVKGEPERPITAIVYQPPKGLGAPAAVRREGAASRGVRQSVILTPLAPDHVGLTSQAQPTLYWYLSAEPHSQAPGRLVVTIIDEDAIQPLAEVTREAPSGPSVQHLDLNAQGITLKPEVDYEWTVALVPDLDNRSGDIIAGGMIRYEQASPELTAKLKQADSHALPGVYAQAGYWYDAIDRVSALIEQNPSQGVYRGLRAVLLEQGKLSEVAALDRRAIAGSAGSP